MRTLAMLLLAGCGASVASSSQADAGSDAKAWAPLVEAACEENEELRLLCTVKALPDAWGVAQTCKGTPQRYDGDSGTTFRDAGLEGCAPLMVHNVAAWCCP